MKLYLPDPSFTSHIWKTLHLKWLNRVNSRLADTSLLRTAAESLAKITDISVRQTLAITDLRTPLSVPTAQFYCSNSRYNGHQSASFDILAELFQIIIISSSFCLRLCHFG